MAANILVIDMAAQAGEVASAVDDSAHHRRQLVETCSTNILVVNLTFELSTNITSLRQHMPSTLQPTY